MRSRKSNREAPHSGGEAFVSCLPSSYDLPHEKTTFSKGWFDPFRTYHRPFFASSCNSIVTSDPSPRPRTLGTGHSAPKTGLIAAGLPTIRRLPGARCGPCPAPQSKLPIAKMASTAARESRRERHPYAYSPRRWRAQWLSTLTVAFAMKVNAKPTI